MKRKKDYSVFKEFPYQDPKMNPLQHKLMKTERKSESSVNSKVLRVSLLGTTNSGKSTLINKMMGHHICAESAKANTTRTNARAILTEADTQVVFLDTPGVTDTETAARFSMERSLVLDPEESLSPGGPAGSRPGNCHEISHVRIC